MFSKAKPSRKVTTKKRGKKGKHRWPLSESAKDRMVEGHTRRLMGEDPCAFLRQGIPLAQPAKGAV